MIKLTIESVVESEVDSNRVESRLYTSIEAQTISDECVNTFLEQHAVYHRMYDDQEVNTTPSLQENPLEDF